VMVSLERDRVKEFCNIEHAKPTARLNTVHRKPTTHHLMAQAMRWMDFIHNKAIKTLYKTKWDFGPEVDEYASENYTSVYCNEEEAIDSAILLLHSEDAPA
jgi:hypothetical protein